MMTKGLIEEFFEYGAADLAFDAALSGGYAGGTCHFVLEPADADGSAKGERQAQNACVAPMFFVCHGAICDRLCAVP